MGFFKSKKGSIISDNFQCAQDQAGMRARVSCEIALYDDYLELTAVGSKTPVRLDYSQITDVYYGARSRVLEKGQSPIGNAVASGKILGGIGAATSVVSNSDSKIVSSDRNIFIISYISSSGEEAFLFFIDVRMYKGFKVYTKLSELLGASSGSQEPITHL